MTGRGFLIRFIDIGLIVLFGFIMISDIENSSRIELAAGLLATDQPPDPRAVQVVVGIGPDDVLSIVDASFALPVRDTGAAIDLETQLADLQRAAVTRNEDLVVLIRPDARSTVQRTVDVMDICDRLGLRKSLHPDLELSRAPEAA